MLSSFDFSVCVTLAHIGPFFAEAVASGLCSFSPSKLKSAVKSKHRVIGRPVLLGASRPVFVLLDILVFVQGAVSQAVKPRSLSIFGQE